MCDELSSCTHHGVAHVSSLSSLQPRTCHPFYKFVSIARCVAGHLSSRRVGERVLFIGTQFSILYTSMYSKLIDGLLCKRACNKLPWETDATD